MLQKLNERIQGFVAWLVIILIAITFTLFGIDYYLQSHHNGNAKVVVNDHEISNQLFETTYRRARSQRDSATLTAESEKKLQQQVLQALIKHEVVVESAKDNGFYVSPLQANSAIMGIPQFQQDGHFSPERYQQAIAGALFTPESFQQEVEQGMLVNQQRFAFMGTAFALESELSRYVQLYMQTRDYQFLTIPTSSFAKQVKVDEKDIESYYTAHKSEFQTPEQVSLQYLKLSLDGLRSAVQVKPESAKRYYEENQANYQSPAQWQVAHILFALPKNASPEEKKQVKDKANDAYLALKNNPKQFEQMVKTASADKLSARDGGKLPWMTAGRTEYDRYLVELTKVNEISKPFKTQYGYEIFKLVDYKPAKTRPFDEVKQSIQEQLVNEEVQAKYGQMLEKLSDLTYQTPDTLQPAADELKLPIVSTKLFSQKGGDEDLSKNQQVVNAAFSHDVLDLANNSEVIQLDNDSVVVFRVKKHLPAKLKPLSEVKEQIVQAIKLQDEAKLARQLGESILKAKPEAQASLIKENNLQWQSVAKAGREEDKVDGLINSLAFKISKANMMDGVSLPDGNFVLVKLDKIRDGKMSRLDKEQRQSLAQQMEANQGIMDYDLYINHLMSQAKIQNPDR